MEFPEGWGVLEKNPFRGAGMDIFCNYTLLPDRKWDQSSIPLKTLTYQSTLFANDCTYQYMDILECSGKLYGKLGWWTRVLIAKYSSRHCSNKNHHSLCLCPKVGLTLNKFRATIYWQQYSNYLQATGSKGVNCFMLLPTHNRVHQAFPDLMHDLKNVIVTFFDLITGKGDSKKVRVAERELGRFCNSCPKEGKS